MSNSVTKNLFSLSQTDKQIVDVSTKKQAIENSRAEASSELENLKTVFSNRQAEIESITERHAQAESQLKEEEQKIVERRKQLSTIGGAKAAKLIEREIDIAGRSLKSLEETAILSLEEVEQLKKENEELESQLKEKEAAFEKEHAGDDKEIAEFQKELTKLDKEREKILAKLDPRLQNLYKRVGNRYPGDAVSTATDGACQSCFRSLPAQTYNQIIAGNSLITCPGCSRILVFDESAQSQEANAS